MTIRHVFSLPVKWDQFFFGLQPKSQKPSLVKSKGMVPLRELCDTWHPNHASATTYDEIDSQRPEALCGKSPGKVNTVESLLIP
jgi:hypothetical protein